MHIVYRMFSIFEAVIWPQSFFLEIMVLSRLEVEVLSSNSQDACRLKHVCCCGLLFCLW